MSLLDIVRGTGLNPHRTSSTRGEYHSPCPGCGGVDRFIVWAETDRYWCRQCGKGGDAIQFCRDFMGLSYREACAKIGQQPVRLMAHKERFKKEFKPHLAIIPSKEWQSKALEFTLEAHENVLNSPRAQKLLNDRGLSSESICGFKLGWNESARFEALEFWGLSKDSARKKVWIPRGIVIPSFWNHSLMRLKIRKDDITPENKGPKYVEIIGSRKTPAVYGIPEHKPILLLESELDAILVQQIAGDLCCSLAIGGASKKPDYETDQLLRRAPLILFALDVDEAGIKAYPFWRSNYPQLKLWPVPQGKSPGDAFGKGVDLGHWIESGLKAFPNGRL